MFHRLIILSLLGLAGEVWARECQIPITDSCPPGNTPRSNQDKNGDGTNDWLVGTFTDDCGNTIETWCMTGGVDEDGEALPDYYLPLLNGVPIGKCPWWGGCNEGKKELETLPDGRECIVSTTWESVDQQYGDSDDVPATPGVDWYRFTYRRDTGRLYVYCYTSPDGPGGAEPDELLARHCIPPEEGDSSFDAVPTDQTLEGLGVLARARPDDGMRRIVATVDLGRVGEAAGGALRLVVGHREVALPTEPGMGPADLADGLARAINADESLGAHGIFGLAEGSLLMVTNLGLEGLALAAEDRGLQLPPPPEVFAEVSPDGRIVRLIWEAVGPTTVLRDGVVIAEDVVGGRLHDPSARPGAHRYRVVVRRGSLPAAGEAEVALEPTDAGCLGDTDANTGLDAVDIQRVINGILQIEPVEGDVDGDGATDAVDLQLLINKVLGLLPPRVDPALRAPREFPLAQDEDLADAVERAPLLEALDALGAGRSVGGARALRFEGPSPAAVAYVPLVGPTLSWYAALLVTPAGGGRAVVIALDEDNQLEITDLSERLMVSLSLDNGARVCEAIETADPFWACMGACTSGVALGGQCAEACGADGACLPCLGAAVGLCAADCADRAEAPEAGLTWRRTPEGLDVIRLTAPDGPGFLVERRCGDEEFVGVAGLDPEHPVAVLLAPRLPPWPGSSLEAAEAALAGALAAVREIDGPDCREQPRCLGRLQAIIDANQVALSALADLVGRPSWLRRPPPALVDCEFRGAPRGGGHPVPLRDGGGGGLYADWEAEVEDPDDPCHGMTPLDCYRDRLQRWTRRICGETDAEGAPVDDPPDLEDLPQPFRDLCQALRDGWVSFADPVCEPRFAGETVPQPRPEEPPESLPEGGTISEVIFDTETFASGVCSYGTFVHELVHVVDIARDPEATRRLEDQERLEALAEAFGEAEARFAAALADGDEAERQAAALAFLRALDAFQAEQARVAPGILGALLKTECHAYSTELEHLQALMEGAFFRPPRFVHDFELLTWQKGVVAGLLSWIRTLLDALGTDLAAADRAAVCDCLAGFRRLAEAQEAHGRNETLWACLADVGPPGDRVPDQYDAIRRDLGCP